MSKVVAIFGAGTGLGISLARRFGREGFRVALIARRVERLDALVEELAAEGIEAAAFSADLKDPAGVPALVAAVRERFGRIDVVEYGPVPAGQGFTSAQELTVAALEDLLPIFLLTPVAVVQEVLPEMMARGEGAILFTHGFSAVMPAPHFSGPGPVMSAARNYLLSLNGELAGTGVFAGTVNVAGAIARSENEPPKPEHVDPEAAFEGAAFSVIDPDDIAELYWSMVQDGTRAEAVIPEIPFS